MSKYHTSLYSEPISAVPSSLDFNPLAKLVPVLGVVAHRSLLGTESHCTK
jgi:hypothetical protein